MEWMKWSKSARSLTATSWQGICFYRSVLTCDRKQPRGRSNKKWLHNVKKDCSDLRIDSWVRLTSHHTHYRSWGRVFMGSKTQPTLLMHWRNIGSKRLGLNPTRSTLLCYNNMTYMQYENKSTQNTNTQTQMRITLCKVTQLTKNTGYWRCTVHSMCCHSSALVAAALNHVESTPYTTCSSASFDLSVMKPTCNLPPKWSARRRSLSWIPRNAEQTSHTRSFCCW